MSSKRGERPGLPCLPEPPSFLPASGFVQTVQPHEIFGPQFVYSTQQQQGLRPQPRAPVAQLPSTMFQYGQKRNVSDAEYVDESMPMLQQGDPTFFGLSANLPMSTYTTQLSAPSQAPKKKLRQSTRGGSIAVEHLPPASTSRVHRPVASSRPRTVHRSQSTPSQRGAMLTERYEPRRLPRQSTANVLMRPTASANPYMSERPPSWNWINELHPSGTTSGMLGSFDNSFQFTWPAIDNGGMSSTIPEVPRAFQSLQAMPEATSNSPNCNNVQSNYMLQNNSFLVPQGTETSGNGWGKTLSPPYENQRGGMDAGFTSQAEHSLPELTLCSGLDVSLFDNMPALDHDFGSDLEVPSNAWGDGSAIVETKAAAQGPNHGTPSPTAEASSEHELAELLQPVASYLSSTSKSHSEDAADEVISGAIAKPEDAGLGSMHHTASTTDKVHTPHSVADCQFLRLIDQHLRDAATCPSNVYVSAVDLDRSWYRSESLLYRPASPEHPNLHTSLSRTSTTTSAGSASAQATISSNTNLTSSPVAYDLGQLGTHTASSTTNTSPTEASTACGSASTNPHDAIQEANQANIEKAKNEPENKQLAAMTNPHCVAANNNNNNNITEAHSNMQEWINSPPSADAGQQPIATRFKMPPPQTIPSESCGGRIGIYGKQVIWGPNQSYSQPDADAGADADGGPETHRHPAPKIGEATTS